MSGPSATPTATASPSASSSSPPSKGAASPSASASPHPAPTGTHSPTPGKSSHRLPGKKERAEELKGLRTPPPEARGGFDVQPAHLYYTSYEVRDEQFAFNDGAKKLVDSLGKKELAGRGSGPDAFAAAYAKVAKRFLEVWGRSVVSIGGAAVGFTVTANNYVSADWFSNKKQYGPPPRKEPPVVIDRPPAYGTVADLKWTGTDQDSGSAVVRALGHVPDFLASHLEKAIDQGLRLGKMYEITPGPQRDDLNDVAGHWKTAGRAAVTSAKRLSGLIETITDDQNSEWQGAMNSFCQTIWGTTAWGGTRYGHGQDWRTNATVAPADRQPILTVLHKTASAVEKACHDLLAANKTATDVSEPAAIHAAKEMIKDMAKNAVTNPLRGLADLTPFGAVDLTAQMVKSFRSHMDYSGINAAVDTYNDTCHDIARTLLDLLPALDEAYLSAPTYQAEEARTEGFGARALTDFSKDHPWSGKGGSGKYDIDLASSEGLDGSHTLDKHVGKTDQQLAQRLRDDLKKPPRPGSSWPYGQPKIGFASTFKNTQSAQDLTQYCINQNSSRISEWLAKPPAPGEPLDIDVSHAPDGAATGRSIDRHDFRTDGMDSADKATDVYGVSTRLKYNKDLHPPFTVTSSMPADTKRPSQ